MGVHHVCHIYICSKLYILILWHEVLLLLNGKLILDEVQICIWYFCKLKKTGDNLLHQIKTQCILNRFMVKQCLAVEWIDTFKSSHTSQQTSIKSLIHYMFTPICPLMSPSSSFCLPFYIPVNTRIWYNYVAKNIFLKHYCFSPVFYFYLYIFLFFFPNRLPRPRY